MRILVLADSHGKDMAGVLKGISKSSTILVISIGRGVDEICAKYLQKLRDVNNFHPEGIIVHLGHNDLVAHPVYNMQPDHLKYYFPRIVSFVTLLQTHHPNSRVVLSSLYPRTEGYLFDSERKLQYNTGARRFSDKVRSSARRGNFRFCLNEMLWTSARKFKEDPSMFCLDGLHLIAEGRVAVGQGWIRALTSDS
jgi:lysophospholipase L1-like esterase